MTVRKSSGETGDGSMEASEAVMDEEVGSRGREEKEEERERRSFWACCWRILYDEEW